MRTRASLLAIPVALALLVAGVSAAAPAAATAAPVVPGALGTYTSTPSGGVLTPTPAFQSIGGTSGQALAAGVAKTVTLAKTPGVTSTITQLMVQVVVLKATAAGTVTIAPGGQPPGTSPTISYSSGTSSTTTLVTTNGSHALTMVSSTAIHLKLSVVGTITGSSTSATGPGGTKLVHSTAVVGQSTGLGGVVPSVGNSAEVPIEGIAGVPSKNVRAVWLSVQALGSGSGAVSFASDPLDPAGASVAPTAAGSWKTSLVLAPVDDNGAFVYSEKGAQSADLRMSVLGWVAETTSGQSAISISGGVQTIDPPVLKGGRDHHTQRGLVPLRRRASRGGAESRVFGADSGNHHDWSQVGSSAGGQQPGRIQVVEGDRRRGRGARGNADSHLCANEYRSAAVLRAAVYGESFDARGGRNPDEDTLVDAR